MSTPPDPQTARDALRITTDNFTLADEECDAFIHWLRTGDSAPLENYYRNLPVPDSHVALVNERVAALERGETKLLTSEEVRRDLLERMRRRQRERERRGKALSNFKIGVQFIVGETTWLCTDVGSRVVVAIEVEKGRDSNWLEGPPYGVPERVFDEYDLPGCRLLNQQLRDEKAEEP